LFLEKNSFFLSRASCFGIIVLKSKHANKQGKLVLRLDGSSLSGAFIQSNMGDPFFRLADDITIAEEIVVGAFESSGQAPPSEPMVLVAGEYGVVFIGVLPPIGVKHYSKY
jgi:hypothetical protein